MIQIYLFVKTPCQTPSLPARRRLRRTPVSWPMVFLALAALFATSCFEPREGCLDIEATNFDAAADKNCCCTYPKLQLEVLPRFDSLVWKPDTAYQYAPGEWFRLKSIVFYLSGFQLIQNGIAIPVSDTLPFQVWGPAGDTVRRTLTNDFLLVRRTATQYTPGTFRPSGVFESIRFRVGVPDEAQQVIPGLSPEGHPLRLQGESLWLGRDTGYVALKLVLTRDTLLTTAPDTLVFSRPDFNGTVIQQNSSLYHESGYDFRVKLTADYKALFRNVQLSTADISTIKQQIAANLPNAFLVSQ